MALALNMDELLGTPRPAAPEASPVEAGAVHSNGVADLARLIPRAGAPIRSKPRSILTAKARPSA